MFNSKYFYIGIFFGFILGIMFLCFLVSYFTYREDKKMKNKPIEVPPMYKGDIAEEILRK